MCYPSTQYSDIVMGLRSKCHKQWAWAEIYKPFEPFVESIPGYLQQITEVLRYAPSCITFIVGVEPLFSDLPYNLKLPVINTDKLFLILLAGIRIHTVG